jgi:ankyrin repeat protein
MEVTAVKHEAANCRGLHKCEFLVVAAENGYIWYAEPLLEKGVTVNSRDKNGSTALTLAYNLGKLETV